MVNYESMSEEEYRRLCTDQAKYVIGFFYKVAIHVLAFIGVSTLLDKYL